MEPMRAIYEALTAANRIEVHKQRYVEDAAGRDVVVGWKCGQSLCPVCSAAELAHRRRSR